MRTAWPLPIVALLGLTMACPSLAAGEPDPAEKAKADQLFAQGKRLFKNKRYAEAAREFQAAYEIAPHPAVLVNIALSHDEAGDLAAAASWYERYLAEPFDKLDNEKIRTRQAELLKLLGRFSITCSARNCVVWVGGIERGPAPLDLFVDAGSHRVEAVVDGQVAAVSMQKAIRGETVEVRLEPRKSDPLVLYAKPEEYSEEMVRTSPGEAGGRALGPGFWVSSGVALAAGVVTTVFGVRTLRAEDDFEASGYTDADAKDTGERDKLITNVFVGVTSVAAAAAIAFAIYDLVVDGETGAVPAEGEPDTGGDVAIVPGPGLGLGIAAPF